MQGRGAGARGGEARAVRTVGGATRLQLGLPGGSRGRASWRFSVPRGRPRRRQPAGLRTTPCVFGALGVAPSPAEAKAKAQTDAWVWDRQPDPPPPPPPTFYAVP